MHESLQNRSRRRYARETGGERRECAPTISSFYQIHAIPLKRLLDHELRTNTLEERSCSLVAGDDPDDQAAGSALTLRESNGGFRYQPAADARALEFTADINCRYFRIEAILEFHQ